MRRTRSLGVVGITVLVGLAVLTSVTTTPAGGAVNAKSVKSPSVQNLLVAGASDLRPAFEQLGLQFTEQTGTKVTFSFGSSGQLAQQVLNGAPFDVFASADVGFVDKVLSAGIGDRTTKSTYAFGRLALWTPESTGMVPAVSRLSNPLFKRIALANPDHAPYGVAAVEALSSAKIFGKVKNRLVYGENVSDAYRLATSGNADAALVSLSLVVADAKSGHYSIVPAEAHKPLQQTLVVTASKKRSATAKAFVALVNSPTGRGVMRTYGFLLPGDPQPAGA